MSRRQPCAGSAHDLATIGAGYSWGRVHRPDADEARKRPDGRTARGLARYEVGRAACYLSKYLSAEAEPGVREPVVSGQAPRRAVYSRPPDDAHALHDAQPAHAPLRLHGRSVRLPMLDGESWLRDYRLRCMWHYSQRHPSTLCALLVAEND